MQVPVAPRLRPDPLAYKPGMVTGSLHITARHQLEAKTPQCAGEAPAELRGLAAAELLRAIGVTRVAVLNAELAAAKKDASDMSAALSKATEARDQIAARAREIADELEHAQLSWDIHAWLMGVVDDPARVQAALQTALLALPEHAAQMTRPDLPQLGLPNAQEMAALSQSLVRGIQAQFAA